MNLHNLVPGPLNPPLYTLATVDDLDEMHSNMLGFPPRVVITPSGSVWILSIYGGDELIMHCVTPSTDGTARYIEPRSYDEAYEYVRNGVVVSPEDPDNPGLPLLVDAYVFSRDQVAAIWGADCRIVWGNLRRARFGPHVDAAVGPRSSHGSAEIRRVTQRSSRPL